MKINRLKTKDYSIILGKNSLSTLPQKLKVNVLNVKKLR